METTKCPYFNLMILSSLQSHAMTGNATESSISIVEKMNILISISFNVLYSTRFSFILHISSTKRTGG